jgi:hypothetical protein
MKQPSLLHARSGGRSFFSAILSKRDAGRQNKDQRLAAARFQKMKHFDVDCFVIRARGPATNHPLARRNAFRRRGVHPQSRCLLPENQTVET